jgi:D-3-phosphoglycerate dehydrogenase
VPAETIAAAGCRAVDWPVLLSEADFITLHTPLTPETRHILDAEALKLVKPTAFVINTARGALIDEPALLAAVQSGRLAGAALDVLGVEPPAPDYALLHDDRILVTPHIAWYSEGATAEVRVQGADNVARVLRGEPPRTPANQVNGQRLPTQIA